MDHLTFRVAALERQLDSLLTAATKLAQTVNQLKDRIASLDSAADEQAENITALRQLVHAQASALDRQLAAITRLEAHDHPPPISLAVFGSARPPDRAPPMLGDGA
jgi:septal ring factor EnvC (AmiA/AmiB activator)